MRLSKFSDYAMQVVLYLAMHPGRTVPIGEIVRAHRLSQNNLMKVVNMLVDGKVLTSRRGRNGGVQLARAAEAVRVGEVVRIMEHHDSLGDCEACILAPGCDLVCLLNEARSSFYATLNRTSIADLVARDRGSAGKIRAAGELARAE